MKLPAGKTLPEIQRQKDKLFIYLFVHGASLVAFFHMHFYKIHIVSKLLCRGTLLCRGEGGGWKITQVTRYKFE